MRLRQLAMLVLGATFVWTLIALAVYLSRWQWNRAVIAGLIALIAEVGLLALRRPHPAPPGPDARLLARFEQTRPTGTAVFRWLEDTGERTSVFVPVLMAAGVIVSALAWTIEQVARHTVGRVGERRIAARLAGRIDARSLSGTCEPVDLGDLEAVCRPLHPRWPR